MSWEIPKDDETSGFLLLEKVLLWFERCLTQWEKQTISRSFGLKKDAGSVKYILMPSPEGLLKPRNELHTPYLFLKISHSTKFNSETRPRMFMLLISAFFFCGLLWDILELDTYHISSDYFSFPLAICLEIATSVLSKHCGKILAFLDMLQTTKIPIVHGMGSAFVWSTQVHQKKWWQIWLEDQ